MLHNNTFHNTTQTHQEASTKTSGNTLKYLCHEPPHPQLDSSILHCNEHFIGMGWG